MPPPGAPSPLPKRHDDLEAIATQFMKNSHRGGNGSLNSSVSCTTPAMAQVVDQAVAAAAANGRPSVGGAPSVPPCADTQPPSNMVLDELTPSGSTGGGRVRAASGPSAARLPPGDSPRGSAACALHMLAEADPEALISPISWQRGQLIGAGSFGNVFFGQ